MNASAENSQISDLFEPPNNGKYCVYLRSADTLTYYEEQRFYVAAHGRRVKGTTEQKREHSQSSHHSSKPQASGTNEKSGRKRIVPNEENFWDTDLSLTRTEGRHNECRLNVSRCQSSTTIHTPIFGSINRGNRVVPPASLTEWVKDEMMRPEAP